MITLKAASEGETRNSLQGRRPADGVCMCVCVCVCVFSFALFIDPKKGDERRRTPHGTG
jgi:hypothetical protein